MRVKKTHLCCCRRRRRRRFVGSPSLKNNRFPHSLNLQFHYHEWPKTGVTSEQRLRSSLSKSASFYELT
ncbi:hypothetical protein ACSBR2_022225 [Camellia fascicularis]